MSLKYGIKSSIELVYAIFVFETPLLLFYLFRLNSLRSKGARLRPILNSRPREGVKNENALLKPILNKETLFQLLRTLFQSFLSICSELFSSFCNKAR